MTGRIKTSKIFEAIRQSTEEIVVLEGSARSTKTYSVLQFLIYLALENEKQKKPLPLRFAIVRSRLTWLMRTAYLDFVELMTNQFGLWNDSDMNLSRFFYQFGNSTFFFSGLDMSEGQKFHGGKYDYIFLNEAIQLDYPSVQQLLMRMTKRMFLDYNPNMDKHHWVETKIKHRDDVRIIHSTYKDNPFLPLRNIKEIEGYEPTPANIAAGTADETAWKIYGLGIRAELRGLIFPNWQIVPEMPKSDNYFYGLDFGYSDDPVAFIKMCIKEGGLYLEEKIYERGLTNIENPHNKSQPSIERRFVEHGIKAKDAIGADSAEPKSIQDLRNCGYDIRGAKKGPNSIIDGITSLKRYKIYIVESSMNLIDNATKYKWLEDRNGNSTSRPMKAHDHCFISGTKITTARGLVSIDNLADDDLVLTRVGWKPIVWHRKTRDANVWLLELSNGCSLIGTGGHKIFTDKGEMALDSLRHGDCVIAETEIMESLWKTKKSFSTDTLIGDIPSQRGFQTESILSEHARIKTPNKIMGNISISRFGNFIAEKFQRVFTSTIKTKTHLTTISKTLSVYLQTHIAFCIQSCQIGYLARKIKNDFLHRRRLGTNQMKDESGIVNTGRLDLKTGSLAGSTPVANAGKNTPVAILMSTKTGFAPTTVNLNGGDYLELMTLPSSVSGAGHHFVPTDMGVLSTVVESARRNTERVYVLRVRPLNQICPVYNLQVADQHEYVANGILVSNCWDAARYGLVRMEETEQHGRYAYDSVKPRVRLLEY